MGEDWGGRLFSEHDQLNDPDVGLAEEWENFMRFDKNDDTEVDLDEWLLQLAPASDGAGADSGQVQRWKKEFEDADLGKDGMLNWNEWRVMLFHEQVKNHEYIAIAMKPVRFLALQARTPALSEMKRDEHAHFEQPQAPGWIDGHDPDALPAPTEDLLLEAFDTHDEDNDGKLSQGELAAVIRDAYRRQRKLALCASEFISWHSVGQLCMGVGRPDPASWGQLCCIPDWSWALYLRILRRASDGGGGRHGDSK